MSARSAIAVLFAGGVGSRTRSAERPKQFLPVLGEPVLVRTLEHSQPHREVAAVYLSCVASGIRIETAELRGNVKLTTDLDLLQFELLADSGQLQRVIGERT